MKKGNYRYTSYDFERYYGGLMDFSEMNELEKASLTDPFLADALEGYAHSKNPVADIEELKKRLRSDSPNREMRMVAYRKWLKYAAIIVSIFAGAYIFYLLNKTPVQKQLASNSQPTQMVETLTTSRMAPMKSISPPETVKSNRNTLTLLRPGGKSEKKGADQSFHDTISSASIGYASRSSVDSNQLYLAPEERKDLYSDDVIKKKEMSLNGRVSGEPNLNKVSALNLDKGYHGAIPFDGWVEFNNYIQQGINKLFTDSSTRYRGVVTIEFSINNQGIPYNPLVTQSLNDTCNKIAISLLLHGPKWKYGKKGYADIRFN